MAGKGRRTTKPPGRWKPEHWIALAAILVPPMERAIRDALGMLFGGG